MPPLCLIMNKFGLDYWSLDFNLNVFLQTVKTHNWTVYGIRQQKDTITFYASVLNRNDLIKTYPHIIHLKTTGVIGMLLRTFKQLDRLIAAGAAAALWLLLSSTVFNIEILGEGTVNRALIADTLVQLQAMPPFQLTDKNVLKQQLNEELKRSFTWIEVEQNGSKLKVRFLPKKTVEKEELTRNELIAQKNGVIASFDLQHGEKCVKINDVVKKGDLLVSNILLDSMNLPEEIYVKGRVFAYTWSDFSVEMPNNSLPEGVQFFQLLFQARRIISEELGEDEKIVSENILQFSVNDDKIKMDLHYTLLEDISSPGE